VFHFLFFLINCNFLKKKKNLPHLGFQKHFLLFLFLCSVSRATREKQNLIFGGLIFFQKNQNNEKQI
ncbi:unnamed protein product, partial [Brassica oleracea var. botrytis]